MLFKYILPSLLATSTVAVPVADIDNSGDNLVLFKRDDLLDARDLELADIHGVNVTEMYKHSMLKRDDGDHVVVWVARDFIEANDGQGVSKRQTARPGTNSNFQNDAISDYCRDHKRQNHAGPNGPFSGGVKAMYGWARGHSGGSWPVGSGWKNLVLAGSNSGANALYRARVTSGDVTHVGTQDVRNDADWTQQRAQKFNGQWRASSKGGETCSTNDRINYEIIRTDYRL
ncbi:hypothetical protein FPSE_02428 [Fusarium pseudograminearum CS3096]|uniref:Ecp2 effector protein domain-containing protein n=1 Tax=Fusarium pseudograminearum (strain CS3096) TaxID=1028729 RepID=K3W2B3_FUSPC|nr:hypothetical protein FPSE_02428 [Fusarium pseudograminearum CS3096]EKJ77350.1 hypothetical protein FPSE_02428 [Fusarium pseudograminearum CS3096]KAF0643975.1 hypothetical protein FPSE5266_02428 [Fusarium pseudograminearum]